MYAHVTLSLHLNDQHQAVKSLREQGYINYFGMQRFGTQSVCTHAAGIAMLKEDWEAAVDLVLMPREGLAPQLAEFREVRFSGALCGNVLSFFLLFIYDGCPPLDL